MTRRLLSLLAELLIFATAAAALAVCIVNLK